MKEKNVVLYRGYALYTTEHEQIEVLFGSKIEKLTEHKCPTIIADSSANTLNIYFLCSLFFTSNCKFTRRIYIYSVKQLESTFRDGQQLKSWRTKV